MHPDPRSKLEGYSAETTHHASVWVISRSPRTSRTAELVDLALVRLPLVASATEPDLHCMNGGGDPLEAHGAGARVRTTTQGPSCKNTVQRCRIKAVSGSSQGPRVSHELACIVDLTLVCFPWSYPRRSRSGTAGAAAARWSRRTVPEAGYAS